VLRVNQIDRGAGLEHHEYLRGSFDRREEHNWLFGAVVEHAEAVLRQACHKLPLAIEDANVNFDDFGCSLNSCLWNPSRFLSVQGG